MDRHRAFRIVRVTAAMVCLVFCAFASSLWLRSYWKHDDIKFSVPNYLGALESLRGECGLVVFDPQDTDPEDPKVGWSWNAASFAVTTATRGWYESNEPFTSALGMRWQFWANGFVFAVSYWFVVVLSATLAAVLMIRRLHRFSLRALLVAMTFEAILLGTIVFAQR
jgi:hypothetical protein